MANDETTLRVKIDLINDWLAFSAPLDYPRGSRLTEKDFADRRDPAGRRLDFFHHYKPQPS